MPYTVFALKWRPKNFDEIIGQEHIVSILKNTIEKDRLAHAYLFSGPRGVGKTSTARIFAKALNCKTGPTVKPCQKCSSCVEIGEGRSLDVIEIDGASNRGIDEIRVLRENVKFAPVSGKFKIYIIDEVHMLTTEAFNALLKTLEEPPDFVKFIFATTQPNKVISTILSRCQRFDFRRIPALEIAKQLEKIVKAEGADVTREVLFAIAKSSDGSLRDAESVLDQLVSFSKEKITLADVVSVLGLVEEEELIEITDRIIAKDAKGALDLFNGLVDSGKDVNLILSHLIEHFRNLMIAKVSKGDAKLIDLPNESCARLLKQSQDFSLEELFSFFNALVLTQEMAKRLESMRIPLEITLIKLAHDKKESLNPSASIPKSSNNHPVKANTAKEPAKEAVVKDKSEALKKTEDKESAQIKKHSLVPIEEVRNSWQGIIDSVAKVKMSVATFLSDGEPARIDGDVLFVSFPKNYLLHKESLERKDNKTLIEEVLLTLLKSKLRISFFLSEGADARKEQENNTIIKSALDMFNGRVIKEG